MDAITGGSHQDVGPSPDTTAPQTAAAGAGMEPAAATFLTEAQLKLDEDAGVEALKDAVAGTTEETQATLLLRKRKDMRMVDEALEAVKKEFKTRMERLAERQARFEEKQRAMQEMVAKFKPFIEENDAKKERALAKAAAEAAAKEKAEDEILRLQAELVRQKEDKAALEARIASYSRYARYLDSVIAAAARGTGAGTSGSAEAFETINDVLARHRTLHATNVDLHRTADSNAAALEALRADIAAQEKRMRDRALVASSASQALAKQLEAARAQASDLATANEFAESDVLASRAAAGLTDTAVRHLHSRVMATAPPNSLPPIQAEKVNPREYLLGALGIICDRITDLTAIVSEYPAWQEQQAREREAAAKARIITGPVPSGTQAGTGGAAPGDFGAASRPASSSYAASGSRPWRTETASVNKTAAAAAGIGHAAGLRRGPGSVLSGSVADVLQVGRREGRDQGAGGSNRSAAGLTSLASFSQLNDTGVGAAGAVATTAPGVFQVRMVVPSATGPSMMLPQEGAFAAGYSGGTGAGFGGGGGPGGYGSTMSLKRQSMAGAGGGAGVSGGPLRQRGPGQPKA